MADTYTLEQIGARARARMTPQQQRAISTFGDRDIGERILKRNPQLSSIVKEESFQSMANKDPEGFDNFADSAGFASEPAPAETKPTPTLTKRQQEIAAREKEVFDEDDEKPKDTTEEGGGFLRKGFGALQGVISGASKGLTNTVLGGMNIAQSALNAPLKAVGSKGGLLDVPKPTETEFGKEFTKPEGTAEKVGFYAEQIGEFLAPAPYLTKGEKAINAAIKGSGFLSGAGRVAAKSALQGAVGGAQVAAQDKGSLESGLKGAALIGGLRATTGAIGELAKAYNIPEKLYQRIFKTNYRDMQEELRLIGTEAFRKAEPERFKELVNAGIIKVAKNGSVSIDETLAKQALDRGLSGSLETMSKEVVRDLYENEAAARSIAKNSTAKLQLPQQYENVLRQVQAAYRDVGLGAVSKEAEKLANILHKGGGSVDVESALRLRRFLDGFRVESSFNPHPTNIALHQQGLRELTDNLRGKINKVPGMSNVMKEYSFNIDALEALAKEATRRGNNQVIGLLDAIFIGGGLAEGAVGVGTGGAAAIGRRIINTPIFSTRTGQAIEKGLSGLPQALIRGAGSVLVKKPKAYGSGQAPKK